MCFILICRFQTLRRTHWCVISWWVATTSTFRLSTTQLLPGGKSFCVSHQHLITPLRWWNTLLVRRFRHQCFWSLYKFVKELFVYLIVAAVTRQRTVAECKHSLIKSNLTWCVYPPQRGWCTPGRRSVWSWSLTLQQSAPSASSRSTLKWWASEKSLTSVASATRSLPARNTTFLTAGWRRHIHFHYPFLSLS